MKSDLNQRALRLLARRDHSRLELRQKLLRSGPSEVVEEVLDELEKKRLLNDESFAVQRALHCRQQRLWGNWRIAQDLKRLGIGAKMIERVLQQVSDEKEEAESLQEAIRLWIEKSGTPKLVSQLKKLYDHCLRLGYAPAQVRGELQFHFDRLDWSEGDLNGPK
ncbi:recombination regulator RecX [Acidobacteria bacterium AH-259-A15]|nr:recombination regulator RecX [Acidobacteria bacterium AH-259-A15]